MQDYAQHRELFTNAGQFNYLVGFNILARRDKLDVFQSHYILPYMMPCATVVGIYDILYEVYPNYFGRLRTLQMKLLVRRSARNADQVITISEYSKKEIVSRYGVSPEKVHVIPCGVSPLFKKIEYIVVRRTLKKYGINTPYILCVGRTAPIKNLSGMLKAFNDLIQNNKEISLVIVGAQDPKFVDESINIAGRGFTCDDKKTIFTGQVSIAELISLYNGAKLFVFPSFGEGFGLPVLEAMACGTPVLCSNKTALPEIAEGVAEMFNPDKQEEFNARLNELINNNALLEKMGSAGPRRSAQYTWTNYAKKADEVYELAKKNRSKYVG